MSKTVFVTGGAGYIGTHIICELLQQGLNIVAIDNFANCIKGKDEMPESLKRVQNLAGKTLKFHEVDLLDLPGLKAVMSQYKIDLVLHMAALKAVGQSWSMPLEYYRNNLTGAMNLVEAMKEVGIDKLVYSSSSTVYGEPTYLPVDEDHPTGNCTNPYGRTKYMCEEIFKDVVAVNKGWSCMTLRYFNPVGAHPSGEIGEDKQGVPQNLFPYVAQVLVGRLEKLKVLGNDYDTPDGTAIRDYVHVMDVAEGHVVAINKLLEGKTVGTQVYNLGKGKGSSVLEVIQSFEKVSGKKIPYEFVSRRKGDVPETGGLATKVEKELGWKAKRTLDDMCKDFWNWQNKNPHGYQN